MFFVLVYVLVCLFCSSLLYIYRYRLFVLFSHYHALLHFAKKRAHISIPRLCKRRRKEKKKKEKRRGKKGKKKEKIISLNKIYL